MSNFIEKIGEKLHIGGHKKEDEHPHQPVHGELHHAGEPPHTTGQGGCVAPVEAHGHDKHGCHAEHGGEHHAEGAAHGEHGGHIKEQHHEGPLEKVKHKVKGKKQDGGDGDSSSSSSESDGEGGQGGRRKKKHGIF